MLNYAILLFARVCIMGNRHCLWVVYLLLLLYCTFYLLSFIFFLGSDFFKPVDSFKTGNFFKTCLMFVSVIIIGLKKIFIIWRCCSEIGNFLPHILPTPPPIQPPICTYPPYLQLYAPCSYHPTLHWAPHFLLEIFYTATRIELLNLL